MMAFRPFSANGASFIESLGQRPRTRGNAKNASAEGAIHLRRRSRQRLNRAFSACLCAIQYPGVTPQAEMIPPVGR